MDIERENEFPSSKKASSCFLTDSDPGFPSTTNPLNRTIYPQSQIHFLTLFRFDFNEIKAKAILSSSCPIPALVRFGLC